MWALQAAWLSRNLKFFLQFRRLFPYHKILYSTFLVSFREFAKNAPLQNSLFLRIDLNGTWHGI
jgi:hypothetical protein